MNRAAWRRLPALDELLRFVTQGDSMAASIRLLDVVALTEEVQAKRLLRGQVGTVVEVLAPGVYEVEFCDDEGRTYTSTALSASQLLVLHYRPQIAA